MAVHRVSEVPAIKDVEDTSPCSAKLLSAKKSTQRNRLSTRYRYLLYV